MRKLSSSVIWRSDVLRENEAFSAVHMGRRHKTHYVMNLYSCKDVEEGEESCFLCWRKASCEDRNQTFAQKASHTGDENKT